ncbi:MAG: MFS transporter, partial [Chloroflexota bacterium]|nr:MFS transporter [Chloroflexota bacterium]
CAAAAGDYVAVQFSAAAFGLMSVGAGLGSAFSPTVGGAIADHLSMNWTFAVASFGSAAGMVGALAMNKKPTKLEEIEPRAGH